MKFWTKLDGKGQKVVVQIKAGGEEYEVYLTNLAKTEDAYEVTVPFSAFKGKTGGKLSGDALKMCRHSDSGVIPTRQVPR